MNFKGVVRLNLRIAKLDCTHCVSQDTELQMMGSLRFNHSGVRKACCIVDN